jgi:hypothetical protein
MCYCFWWGCWWGGWWGKGGCTKAAKSDWSWERMTGGWDEKERKREKKKKRRRGVAVK